MPDLSGRHCCMRKIILIGFSIYVIIFGIIHFEIYRIQHQPKPKSSLSTFFPYTKSNIPKVIWQTAKSHNAPPAALQIMHTWDDHNPDWTHILYDDAELLSFMNENLEPREVKAWKKLPLPVMKADFFRLAVMYFEGGIYADVDVENVLPIKKWPDNMIDSCEVIIGMENDAHVCNWGFASRKQHPLFETAYKLSISKFINGVDTRNEHFVHATTGPGVLTEAVIVLVKDLECGSPENAKEIYESCGKALKRRFNICYVAENKQKEFFNNHYSSQKKELQSEEWVSSWTEGKENLISAP